MSKKNILQELDDGLVLRRSSPQDAQALADFNATIHGDPEKDRRDDYVAAWAYDLLTRPHPTFKPDDFIIVEDSKTGQIVSSLNLISQTWAYEDVPFGVGRPELVGTHPDYRNRGLIRLQFDEIHKWSAARGEMVQAITGIPYYYRLFGYEMALNLGGSRSGFQSHIPKLKEDEKEPYLVRPAVEDDLPLIAGLYESGSKRSLVRDIWTPELWRFELLGKSKKNIGRTELRIIEAKNEGRVGFLAHSAWRWRETMGMHAYELKPGVSWAAVTPSVVRYLAETGKKTRPHFDDHEFSSFSLSLGAEHPAYQVIQSRLPKVSTPYAWYLRVADLPAFIQRISPVLERRLAESIMVSHTGEVKLTFYQDGLRMKFERGKLVEVESHQPHPAGDSGDAGFPGLTFLQLVFGYRSLEELKYAYPDCWTDNDTTLALLPILFPKKASNIWGIS